MLLLDPTNQNHYNIMSAVRGLDFTLNTIEKEYLILKCLTTGVIRDAIGVDRFTSGALVNNPAVARGFWSAQDPSVRDAVRDLYRRNGHFRTHVEDAFMALRGEGLLDPEYIDWVDEIMRHHDA